MHLKPMTIQKLFQIHKCISKESSRLNNLDPPIQILARP